MTDARDIVERLQEVCTDWDGSQMKDAEEPRAWLSVGEIREAANEIASLRKQLEDARSEALEEAADRSCHHCDPLIRALKGIAVDR